MIPKNGEHSIRILPNEAFHRVGEERRSPPGELVVTRVKLGD